MVSKAAGARRKQAASAPTSKLVRTAAYYKLFTTTMFVILGVFILVRSLTEGGALGPALIGLCLIGLGLARWVAVYRARRS